MRQLRFAPKADDVMCEAGERAAFGVSSCPAADGEVRSPEDRREEESKQEEFWDPKGSRSLGRLGKKDKKFMRLLASSLHRQEHEQQPCLTRNLR